MIAARAEIFAIFLAEIKPSLTRRLTLSSGRLEAKLMYPVIFLGVEPLVSRRSCMADTTRAAIFMGLIFLSFFRAIFVSLPAIVALRRVRITPTI